MADKLKGIETADKQHLNSRRLKDAKLAKNTSGRQTETLSLSVRVIQYCSSRTTNRKSNLINLTHVIYIYIYIRKSPMPFPFLLFTDTIKEALGGLLYA